MCFVLSLILAFDLYVYSYVILMLIMFVLYFFFFFFKQKTAYEMRISDWSSDVCSSDLFFGWAGVEEAEGAAAVLPAFQRGRVAGLRVPDMLGQLAAGLGRHVDTLEAGAAGRRPAWRAASDRRDIPVATLSQHRGRPRALGRAHA